MNPTETYNFNKYLKYKQKYLRLKQLQTGGASRDKLDKTNKKLTYSLCVDYDDTFNEVLRRILNRHNFKEIPFDELYDGSTKSKKTIDFLFLRYIKTPIIKEYQLINCRIKNELSGSNKLFNKCTLHKLINDSDDKKLRSHIPKTRDLKDIEHLEKGQILILRPCAPWASSGKGIVRVATEDELQKEKRKYKSNNKFSIIASEYIRNPLLFDNRKFHLRMYMIFTVTPKFRYELAKIGKILTAKKPYVDKYFDDLDIHDTHVHSTKHDYFFPKDFNETNIPEISEHISSIWDQMDYICGKLSNFVKHDVKPYEESESGYYVFGLDFMVDTAYHVLLIECNNHPGYANIDVDDNKNYVDFLEQHFEWIYDRALKPFFNK
jgi:hypothetical protein